MTTTKTSAKARARVLIVDDDSDSAEALGDSLTGDRYACELAPSGIAALEAVGAQPFDVVISDIRMEGMSGLNLLDRLTKAHPRMPVIMVTGINGLSSAVEATKRGAFQYLSKPYDMNLLRATIAQAVEEREGGRGMALREGDLGSALITEIIGREPAMTALLECVERVAMSSAPVLILGESGSGKELVAHAVHARGPRGHRPFVAVNVSAIPEQLLESEMFGHVRGAFTGASGARRGLFLEASGGTLFLDEIGDMPYGLQAKLLRVLQSGEVRAIGSDTVRTVDVRIIAATHGDLPAMIQAGRFREDLYYRLNVLPLRVPSLRERRGDIRELASFFLAQAQQRTPSSSVRAISAEALDVLVKADWPGNVRQLANAMERLVVFGREATIVPRHLAVVTELTGTQPTMVVPLAMCTLRELNEQYVASVMRATSGDKLHAAEILGINLSTLYRWQRRKTSS